MLGGRARSVKLGTGLRLAAATLAICLFGPAWFTAPALASPGNLDPTFGVGGVALTSIGDGDAQATAVAQTSGGGVVAAGSAVSGGALGFAISSYTASGAANTAFGTNGVVATSQLGQTTSPQVNAIAVEGDGDILVAGSGDTSGGATEVLLALYSPSGQLVSGFGTGGYKLVAIGNGGNSQANAVVLDGSDVLVAGRAVNISSSVGRFEEFFESFNAANGAAISGTQYLGSFGNQTDTEANAITLDGSDVLLAGFTATASGYKDALVTKLSASGALQTSFDASDSDPGASAIDFGLDAEANAVVVESSGRIVLDGQASNSQGLNEVMVAALNSSGSLDTSFGSDGVNALAIGTGNNASAQALAVDASGNLLVAGDAADTVGSNSASLPLVARFTSAGELDTTFAPSSRTPGAELLACNTDAGLNAGYVDGSGDLVVAGHSGADVNHQAFLVARYGSSATGGTGCGSSSGGSGSGSGGGGSGGSTGSGSGGGSTGSGSGGGSTGAGGCSTRQLTFGVLVVKACFTQQGTRYLATGSISLDGLSIAPSPCTSLVFDTVADTIQTECNQGGSGEVAVSAPTSGGVISGIPLYRGSIDWTIPTADGDDLGELDVGSFAELEGFPLIDQVDPEAMAGGKLELPLTTSLPSPFDSVQGTVTLQTAIGQPVALNGIEIGVPEVWLGPLDIQNFSISYTASTDTWAGSAEATFASPLDYGVGAGAQFRDNSLAGFSASVDLGDPGVPLGDSGVFLQEINFGISTDPLTISGGIGLDVADTLTINGTLTVEIPRGGWDIRLAGNVSLVGIGLANGYLEIDSNGNAFFGGGIDWGSCDLLCVDANADGWIDLSNSTFDAYANSQISVLGFSLGGGAVNVSSKSIAVCGEASWGIVSFSLGAAYVYGHGISIMGGADVAGIKIGNGGQCDLSGYELTAPTPVIGSGSAARGFADGHAAGSSADELTVRPRTHGLVWRLQGSGAPPQVTISGPGGVSLASSADGAPVKTSNGLILQDPSTNATYVVLAAPHAGHWIITPLGSSTITQIATAGVLPPPHVTARVSGSGLARVLRYTLKPIKGQSVRFLEHEGTFTRLIATVTKAHGTIKFTPADGPAGRRTIIAQVLQGISIRKQLNVASYQTPAQLGPQQPRKLLARHTGDQLHLSWRSGGGATLYLVQVTASSGGTTVLQTKATQATVRLPAVAGATVSVTPRTAFAEQGKAALVKLAAPVAPKLSKRPAVRGTAQLGATVSCVTGRWSGHPTRLVVEWLKAGVTVAGADHTKLKLSTAYAGKAVSCTVTARNAAGFAVASSSSVKVPKRLKLKKPRSSGKGTRP